MHTFSWNGPGYFMGVNTNRTYDFQSVQTSCSFIINIDSWIRSVEPGQLASSKPADLDMHCFQKRVYNFE